MKKSNLILNSFMQSFAKIWNNKSLFALLFVLQIAFFGLFFSISLKYQTKIMEDLRGISDYLSQQQLDDFSIAQNMLQQKDILGEDPLIISKLYNEMEKNFRIYLIFTFILLTSFVSLVWTLTSLLVQKDKKHLLRNFSKNFIIMLCYLGLIFSFFYSLFSISLTEAASQGTGIFIKYVPFLIITPLLIYFMFISLSLSNKISLGKIVEKTLLIGVKKIHYILSAHAINIVLFVIPIILLYNFLEENLLVLLLSVILLIFSFVFGRIFLANVVDRLENL